MKSDSSLFPGCYRRNIGLEKLALVLINISQKDTSAYEIRDLFNSLDISSSTSISKNEDSKIIKIYFKCVKDKLNILSNHYRNGFSITLNNVEVNIKVEPCIRAFPQCDRCNKLQHRIDKCREKTNHFAYCDRTNHSESDCQSSEFYCTNCGGNHNAYNFRECEKYKSLKKLKIKKKLNSNSF